MSGWPRDRNDKDYRDCVKATCPSKHEDLDAKCYAQDNTNPDGFTKDQFCAYETDDGTIMGLNDGCCQGEDIAPGSDSGQIKVGCPGQCDNVKYERSPQAGNKGRQLSDDDDDDDDDDEDDKNVKKGIIILLSWVLVLVILSSIAYFM